MTGCSTPCNGRRRNAESGHRSPVTDNDRRRNRIDASDLLWTINSLRIDAGTRAAYTNDLRASANAIEKAQAASLEHERETLARTKQSLEVLIEAEGRYRIEGARIIFDDLEFSDRFVGKSASDKKN